MEVRLSSMQTDPVIAVQESTYLGVMIAAAGHTEASWGAWWPASHAAVVPRVGLSHGPVQQAQQHGQTRARGWRCEGRGQGCPGLDVCSTSVVSVHVAARFAQS